jgi:CheY-like chemotaxis protein
VLDMTKIEAGRLVLSPETVDVALLVREATEMTASIAQKNRNVLEFGPLGDAGTIHADPIRVRQVLFNLLSNAQKFTEDGRVQVRVRREPVNGRDWVVFEVADTGIGMTAEQQSRIFREFTQADASTTRKYGGTGLGLAISRRLCQLMGGDIGASSEPGKGSTFTMRVPAEPVAPAAVERAAVPGTAATTMPTSQVATVLVIDDDPSVRDLVSRQVARLDVEVIAATAAMEGIRLAEERLPALITLDVNMPGASGWDALVALKRHPRLAAIPVVMLTIGDERQQALSLGAAALLTKPVDGNQLRAVLSRYLPAEGDAAAEDAA